MSDSWYKANVIDKELLTERNYDEWNGKGWRLSSWFDGMSCVASARLVDRYESGDQELMYLYADTKELFTGTINYWTSRTNNVKVIINIKDGKHHCVGYPAYIGIEDIDQWYYLDGMNYGRCDDDLKEYWKRCWDEYRTEENEKMIMAKLLAAK